MAQAIKKKSFTWSGKNKAGKVVTGETTSSSVDMVKAELRKQGIVPKKVSKKSAPFFGGSGKKITAADISVFSRQLATMMKAGVPLVQSFEITAEGHSNPSMSALIRELKATVEAGGTFASALKQHPLHFDDLFCNLVEAGEQSGALETLLEKIATYKEKTEALKARIKKAMFYPMAVIIFAFVVSAILLIWVVPVFADMFKGFGADLPSFTVFVVGISDIFVAYWWAIFGSIFGVVAGIKELHKRSRKFRRLLDRMVLKAPVAGHVVKTSSVARFARTLSTMFAAGVPLVEAMNSVAGASGNSVYTNAIFTIRDDIATGQQLQASMRNHPALFPNMVIQMVSIGEESGALDEMLAKVADYYEAEVDNAVDSMTSLMEPLIMAFLAVVIGGLVIAMYLPIFKMGSAIKGG